MKQKTYPVSQSSESQELVYLNNALVEFTKRIYIRGTGYTSFGDGETKYFTWNKIKDTTIRDGIISELYRRGRAECRIHWTFNQFRHLILNGFNDQSWSPEPYKYLSEHPIVDKNSWVYRRSQRHQCSTKYQHQAHHTKKELTDKEQSRRDWREHKQFNRDKSKNRTWCKCGGYGKDIDHRGRRAYERTMIANERWDEMYDHKDMFYDSWSNC